MGVSEHRKEKRVREGCPFIVSSVFKIVDVNGRP